MTNPATAGWYDDPDEPDQLRYFDGIVWTAHTTPRVSPTAASSTIGHAYPTPAAGTRSQPGQSGSSGHRGSQSGQSGNPWAAPPVTGGAQWQGRRDVLPDGAVLAEWWRRLVARIVDWVLVGVITTLLAWPFLQRLISAFDTYFQDAMRQAQQGGAPDTTAFTSAITEAALPISLISLAVTVLYETVFLVWRSATPGKMLFGTTVRRVGRAGGIGLVDALKRQLLTVAADVVGFVPLVGIAGTMLSIIDPAWLLWDPKRQALHDKVADTVVVLARR